MKRKRSTRAKSPLKTLTARLDREFSRYVRLRDSDENGTGKCCTCGKLLYWKDAHACHFVSRRHMATRWDERNVHLGCPRCNTFLDGALDEYSAFIIDRYGKDTFDELLRLKRTTKNWLHDELKSMADDYAKRAKTLESNLTN